MKHHPTLPTKRQPVRKSVFKTLFANIPGRKQRVAATANPADFETELPGRKIGNALAVIVAVHVAAAGLVFFHHWRLEGRGGDVAAKQAPDAPAVPLYSPGEAAPAPLLAVGDQSRMANAGETYASIAAKLGVEESDLRAANNFTPIRSGLVMKIPPKKIVAMESPEVIGMRSNPSVDDRGIVEVPKATIVDGAPQLVRPSSQKITEHSAAAQPKPAERTVASLPKPTPTERPAVTAPKPAAGARSYTVQSGDNFWRIANKFKVDQAQLMKANGITDAKKLRIGMNLVIPN